MKRFNWRLQRVLDIKQKEEQVKRAQLVTITEQLSQVRGELFMQKRKLEELIDSLSEKGPQERVDRQALFMKYSATNDKIIKELENKIKSLTTRQKDKTAEVIKIKQFNEALEKLRADAKTEFIAEQEKHEQKELDDTTTSRAARKIMAQSKEVVV